jgi:two-component system NtrC family response regulator
MEKENERVKDSVLIVDDEPNYLIVLRELLREEGYEVFTAGSGEEGLEMVNNIDLYAVVTDMMMPGINGLEFMTRAQKVTPGLPVIVITAFAEVERAVEAMRKGAFNYLSKPFSNDELIVTVGKAVEHFKLILENTRLRRPQQRGYSGMVGKNPRMMQVYDLIEKVAPTQASVLINGESGTGKELVARAIHERSKREGKPFIAVNCAALSDNLLESELFGHEKGAFTGAATMRKGRFEIADGGTIFLDEVGEIPLQLQSKLLRVLQEKSFERVGGSKTLEVDVRILSATNRDLREEVSAGRFREDLFYRLNVIPLSLPALRERLDDLPLLVGHFLEKGRKELAQENLHVSPEAMQLLMRLPWEGNIRELENTIERAAILCSNGEIRPEDVQPDTLLEETAMPGESDLLKMIPRSATLNEVLYSVEKGMLSQALEENDNVQARAAEQLGITKSLLQYKMKKYQLKKKSK